MTRIPDLYLQNMEVSVMTATEPVSVAYAHAFRAKVIQGIVLLAAVVLLLIYASVWAVVAVIAVLGLLSASEVATSKVATDSFVQDASFKEVILRLFMASVVVLGTLSACRLYATEPQLQRVFYVCFIGVIVTDGAAQLSGMAWYRLFGRRTRMAFGLIRPFKYTSPKKTIIGFIGGIVLGGIAIAIVDQIADGTLSWWFMILIPVCAETGDLIASYAKRTIGIKDYTLFTFKPLLGEHGGVLDRGDGHWFTFMIVGAVAFTSL